MAIRNAASAREPKTRRSFSATASTPHALVTVIRRAQNSSDHTTRLATISTAPAGIRMKKYRGSSPHKTYAPMPNSMPAVESLATGRGPSGAGGAGAAVVATAGVAGEVPSGVGTKSITASCGQVFQQAGGIPENNQ